jgi:hypothetical protein
VILHLAVPVPYPSTSHLPLLSARQLVTRPRPSPF